MGNLSVLSLLWFHDTKEKQCSQEEGGSWGAESIWCPQMGAQDRPGICRRRKRHLEMGQREITAPRGCQLLKETGWETDSVNQEMVASEGLHGAPADRLLASSFFSTHWR